jgi:hypothetical protein
VEEMSLDVYLELEGHTVPKTGSGIFIRENGSTREISREEWDERNPDREPVIFQSEEEETTRVYHANITHNLNAMADDAGLYMYLWKPENLGITKAQELIKPLEEGLALLKSDPTRFRKFNPENRWGTYEGLVEFVSSYLEACKEYPEAKVEVWR